MRGPLNPYLLGGGASSALLAAALAAFISLAALVSESSLTSPDVGGFGSRATGAVEVDLPGGAERARPRGLAATVTALPSAPIDLVSGLIDPVPERGERGRRGGGRDGTRRDDGRRDGRGGGSGGGDVVEEAPGGVLPIVPRPPPASPAGPARDGGALGHVKGSAAPPGHGGSPPGRAKRGAASGTTADSQANKNGKVPPGQAKNGD